MDSTSSSEKNQKCLKKNKLRKNLSFPKFIFVDMMKLRKLIQNKEISSAKTLIESLIWKTMNGQSARKWFLRLKIKLFQRVVFVWHIRLKLTMRVSEERHGLLKNITRLRRPYGRDQWITTTKSCSNELLASISLSFFQ